MAIRGGSRLRNYIVGEDSLQPQTRMYELKKGRDRGEDSEGYDKLTLEIDQRGKSS